MSPSRNIVLRYSFSTAMDNNRNSDEADGQPEKKAFNRRSVVQTLGAIGGAGLLSSTGIGSAAATSSTGTSFFDDIDRLSQATVTQNLQTVLSVESVKTLKQKIESQGVSMSAEDAVAFDASVNPTKASQAVNKRSNGKKKIPAKEFRKLNNLNPVSLVVPFTSSSNQSAGVLFLLVGDNTAEGSDLPGRIPLTLRALFSQGSTAGSQESTSGAVSTQSTDAAASADVKAFGWNSDTATADLVDQKAVTSTTRTSSDSTVSTDAATPQISLPSPGNVLSCGGCLALVTYICDQDIVGALAECASYCADTLIRGPEAYVACSAP